jgi:Protein of unknown function (DUF2004)
LPYFEHWNNQTLETHFDAFLPEKDLRLSLALDQPAKELDAATLPLVRSILDNIPAIDELLLDYIQQDFKQKGNAAEYINHFLEYADPSIVQTMLQKSTQKGSKPKRLASLIRLMAFRITLHANASFLVLDYTINPIGAMLNNYVLTVSFDKTGEMTAYSMES